jgi:hypothetical protein
MDFVRHITWRPEIGDPSLLGWITVTAYAAAAIAAFAADSKAALGRRGPWLMVALLMAFLCVNKELDLQSLVTDVGRALSREYGWYEARREVQKWFVAVVLAGAGLASIVLIMRFRDFWRSRRLLGAGLAFLLTFVVVRAISFHHVDEFLGVRLGGVRMNVFLELGGIAMVLWAAIRDVSRRTRGA